MIMDNNEMMLDYLLGMGAMQPEMQDLRRRQAMIDQLRAQGMQAPQGQMVGKHYVPPSLTQYASQLGQGYMAGQAQGRQQSEMQRMNEQQRKMIEDLRRRRQPSGMPVGLPDIPGVTGGVSDYTDF